MKSNKNKLIFLGLVVFSGQIVQAKLHKKSEMQTEKELMLPVADMGLNLPKFSVTHGTLEPQSLGFVAINAPKKYETKEEKQEARLKYTNLTRLKDVKSMTKERCMEVYAMALDLGYYDDALFYLKHLVTVIDDKYELQKLACQKADIHFAMGQYSKAATEYQAYLDTYPSASNSESALFHYIVALNTQRPRHDQDQELTHQVIRYAEKYILEPTYKKYVAQVKSIHKNCYVMLYDNEKSILEFYLKTKKPVAAEGRYAYLKQKYYEDFPMYRAEILALGCDVAHLQGNEKLYNERLAFLDKQFPSHRVAYLKKSFRDIM